jgi:signal transduction histidine kinase
MRIVITTILPRPGPQVSQLGHPSRRATALFGPRVDHYPKGVPPLDQIDDPIKLRRLVQAMLMIEGELSLPIVLRHLVGEACALVDARYGALGVLSENGTTLDQFLTVGLEPDEEFAIGPRPSGRGVLGTLIIEAKPLRLSNIPDSPDSYGFPSGHPPMTSFLGVPVRVRGEVYGNLYLTEKVGAKEFSAEDEATAVTLAMAAGIAIENARLHSVARDHTLTEDRDRIARDLHDTVIQRLFAVGLSLQGTARLVDRPEVAARIGDAIIKLDETIRHLRTAIFNLEMTINQDGFRRMVFDLLHELTPVIGAVPHVTFTGLVDSAVSGSIADHSLATLREALTNVGRHAAATRVAVTIAAENDLRLVVVDDGRGMANAGVDGRGLKNMRTRAERLGGSLELGTSREGGTRLIWRIPLTLGEG